MTFTGTPVIVHLDPTLFMKSFEIQCVRFQFSCSRNRSVSNFLNLR